MAHTPYPSFDDSFENPSIYCSNDRKTWVEPDGLTNPVVSAPAGDAFNSDPDIVLVGGTMYLFWRHADGTSGGVSDSEIRFVTSTDGLSWTSYEVAWSGPLNENTSPALVVLDGVWHMWYVDTRGSGDTVYRETASAPAGPWSTPQPCTFVNKTAGRLYWHIDVARINDTWVMLINDRANSSSWGGALYLAVSRNGLAWKQAPSKLTPSTDAVDDFYRSTLVYDAADETVRFWLNEYFADSSYVGKVAYAQSPPEAEPSGLPVTDGLRFHYDAEQITGLSNGDPVTQWDDVSGNDRHLVQSTGANQPTFQTGLVNGRPGVRFDGVNDRLRAVFASALAQPATVFLVARLDADADLTIWMDGIDSDNRHYIAHPNGTGSTDRQRAQSFAGTVLEASSTGLVGTAEARIMTLVFDGASSEIRRDSVQLASGNAGTDAQGGLTLGSRFTEDQGFVPGDFYEVVGYDGVLSSADRDAVISYLSGRWQ